MRTFNDEFGGETYETVRDLADLRDQILELLHQAKDIVDHTSERDFAHAYVWGNLFAEEFGFLGRSGGDYLNEVIERLAARIDEEEGEEE